MIKKSSLQEEAKRFLENQNRLAERALSKWSKNSIGYGLQDLYAKNPAKAKYSAMMLENQERTLKQMSETMISQSFQTRPENVLKVARIGSANSKRGDFAHEVALQTTDDAIFYLKTVYANTITGKQQTANEYSYEKAYYTSAGELQRKETVGNGTASYSITPDQVPIIPGKVMITLDGELVGYDDGAGVITVVGTKLTSGTIASYATGTVALVFAAAVAATSTITVICHFDSEQSALYTQQPKLNLEVTKKRFSARPMEVGYSYSMMTELVLQSTGIGDTNELLLAAVGDEHAKAKDFRAINRMKALALSNGTYTFDAAFGTAGEMSDKLHAQKLLSVIGDIGGDLYNSISRGVINKIVAGSKFVTYCKKHDLWKDDFSDNRVGVFKAGNLSDIEVFQCPALSGLVEEDSAILTFKNPDQPLDIGCVFGVMTELTASLLYPNLYIDGTVAIVEDALTIDPRFMRYLTISNLPVYTA